MTIPYKLVSLGEVENAIDFDVPVSFDVETDGFYGTICLAQFYQPDWDAVLMVRFPDPIMLALLLNRVTLHIHNAHYEASTVQTHCGQERWAPKQMQDTFLLSRLAFPEKEEFSLDKCLEYALGVDPYKQNGIDKKKYQKSNWNGALSDEQLVYAAIDVYYLPELVAKCSQMIGNINYKVDMLTLRYCLDFQRNGMPLDKARMFAAYDRINKEVNKLQASIPVNVNSPKQVKEWLDVDGTGDLILAEYQLDPQYDVDKNIQCMGELITLADGAGRVRKLRKLKKQLSFITKWEDTAVEDRIYGLFKPSARTGRLTSNDQNLQQLPRALKDCFGVGEGRVLIYADYAQIELRHICAITKCKTMEQLFRNGEDLHTYTAKMLFGDPEVLLEQRLREAFDANEGVLTKDQEDEIATEVKKLFRRYRQISKTCNFSLLYGGGISMFIGILIKTADILLTETEANRTRAKWRSLWREIYNWQERGIARWRKGMLTSTPLGRKAFAKRITDYLNVENQGGSADVNKLAMHYAIPRIKEYNEQHSTDYFVCNNIHDSFILEGPDEPVHYQAVAAILAEEMQRAWFECSKHLAIKDLPMPVDVAVGKNWGDIENDDVDNIYDFHLEPYAMLEAV